MAKGGKVSAKTAKQADKALKKAAAREPKAVRITERQKRALRSELHRGRKSA